MNVEVNRIAEIWGRIVGRVVIDPETGCWLWTGPTSGNNGRGAGYPRMSLDGCTVAVHRIIWQLVNGPLVGAKQLDHRCRLWRKTPEAAKLTRLCVNPSHLYMVTHKQNQKLRDEGRRMTDRWLRSQGMITEAIEATSQAIREDITRRVAQWDQGEGFELEDDRYDGLTIGRSGRQPDARGPITPEEVQRSWIPQWWGLMDCDRCLKRTGLAPCLDCPTLKDKMRQLNKRRGYD